MAFTAQDMEQLLLETQRNHFHHPLSSKLFGSLLPLCCRCRSLRIFMDMDSDRAYRDSGLRPSLLKIPDSHQLLWEGLQYQVSRDRGLLCNPNPLLKLCLRNMLLPILISTNSTNKYSRCNSNNNRNPHHLEVLALQLA